MGGNPYCSGPARFALISGPAVPVIESRPVHLEVMMSGDIGISVHRLGNFLAVALGQAEFLLNEADELPPDERRQALALIRQAILDARDVVRGVEPPVRARPSGSQPTPPRRSDGRNRILVIDDEEDVRETIAELLMQAGLAVESAADGLDGIRRYRAQPFDCVLTDFGMPGLTGLAVSRAIKDHDPKAFVVLMTGSENGIDGRELQAAAVDRLMVKPATREELLTAVRA